MCRRHKANRKAEHATRCAYRGNDWVERRVVGETGKQGSVRRLLDAAVVGVAVDVVVGVEEQAFEEHGLLVGEIGTEVNFVRIAVVDVCGHQDQLLFCKRSGKAPICRLFAVLKC